ncbi:MAG: hypothetical protein WDN28_30570 [Chthoniobacter sp.]
MKMHRSRLSSFGFSLVEVVLALGISAFGLVSILGLLNAGADSDGAAGRDTTLVSMSNYVLNEMRAAPFDALWAKDPANSPNATPSMDAPVDSTYYFTDAGVPVAAADASTTFDLLYMCVVHKTADSLTQNTSTGYYNQLKLQLEFSWPATGEEAAAKPGDPPPPPAIGKAGTQTLYASIARR